MKMNAETANGEKKSFQFDRVSKYAGQHTDRSQRESGAADQAVRPA